MDLKKSAKAKKLLHYKIKGVYIEQHKNRLISDHNSALHITN